MAPLTPRSIGRGVGAALARTAVMRDGYLYVAGGERGLRVVSVLYEQPNLKSPARPPVPFTRC